MRKSVFVVSMFALTLAVAPACATKKFVRTEVGQVNDKVTTLSGSLEQTKINWDVTAPSSGASMAWFYSVGLVFSVSAALVLLVDLYKVLTGRAGEADLVIVREEQV